MPRRTTRCRRSNGRQPTEKDTTAVGHRQNCGTVTSTSVMSYMDANSSDQSECYSDSSLEEEFPSAPLPIPSQNNTQRSSHGYHGSYDTGSRCSGELPDWTRPGSGRVSLTEAISSWVATEDSVPKQSLHRLLKSMKRYDPSISLDARMFHPEKSRGSLQRNGGNYPNWITEMLSETDEIEVTSSPRNGSMHRTLPEQSARKIKIAGVRSLSSGHDRSRKRPRESLQDSAEEHGLRQVVTAMGMKIDMLSKELRDIKKICLEAFRRPRLMEVPNLPNPADSLEELSSWFQDIDDRAIELAATRSEATSLRTTVTNAIRIIMTKNLVQQFTWSGTSEKRDKQRFRDSEAHLFVTNLLKYTRYRDATQEQIGDAVKRTFYNSKDWDGGRNARRKDNVLKIE